VEFVNDVRGLTPDEVALLWRTAPPRMPVGELDALTDIQVPRSG